MGECYCVVGYHVWTTSLIDKIAGWKMLGLNCPEVYVFDTPEAGASLIVGYKYDRKFPIPASASFQEWNYISNTFNQVKNELEEQKGPTYEGDYYELFHYNSLLRNVYIIKTDVPHVRFSDWKPDLSTLYHRLYTGREVAILQSFSGRTYDIPKVMSDIITTSKYPDGMTCDDLLLYYRQLFVDQL